MIDVAPSLVLRGIPDSPGLTARLVHWSAMLRRLDVEPGQCTVLVERHGWPAGARCRVQAHVAVVRHGRPAVVISDAAEISTASEPEVMRQAQAAVDRVFSAVLEVMTSPVDGSPVRRSHP
jgi:hypothetical protein